MTPSGRGSGNLATVTGPRRCSPRSAPVEIEVPTGYELMVTSVSCRGLGAGGVVVEVAAAGTVEGFFGVRT